MYLKRDRLIRKQLQLNRKHPEWKPLPTHHLQKLQAKAHQQLSLQKIVSRQMDYSKIQHFLILATPAQRSSFYNKLRNDLTGLFGSQKAQKTFQNKWTLALKSNVMSCFSRIAKDFLQAKPQQSIRTDLSSLYTDTLEKLLTTEKLSRIQEKFLEPFLVEMVRFHTSIQAILGTVKAQKLLKAANVLSRTLAQRQTPKTLTSNQFLKYCALRVLNSTLPHQKYLHSQLLHAPNPKYLLPFRRKGTFAALTNELLLKSNKLDMVGCQFWSYYQYQQADLYQKIRRAAEWGGRVDILLVLIKPKLVCGLQRCLNLINQKVLYYSNRALNQQGINTLMALVQTSLCIFHNHSHKQPLFETALEKVDIGQVFQNELLAKQTRLRPFTIALLQLYLLLLVDCPKRNLRQKFIPHLSNQLVRLLDQQNDQKFTDQICRVSGKLLQQLKVQERAAFVYGLVQSANHHWQQAQQLLLSNEIALISIYTVRLVAQLVTKFGFSDQGRPQYKVLKLQFYYILALNYKESEYFDCKPKLSRTLLDINPSLANNSIFMVLQTRQSARQAFLVHLRSLYGEEVTDLDRPQHQGLLAAIDQVVTYRIQQTKSLARQQSKQIESYYSLMVNLLEQVQRLESNGKLLNLVKQYFFKCKKTYLIQILSLKARDQTRSSAQKMITKDACYLIQSCVSANPMIAEFSWTILQEYIQKIPQLAIYTGVLVVWAQCISILYRKNNQEYESRSQRLRGKWLVSGTLIPTQSKQILYRMKVLMKGLYQVVLRGHLIDDDYLGIRVQYLIREHCKSTSFGFGWKLLKHLTNSFKEDSDFISKEILTNNSCSWFVNQQYFNTRLRKIKPEKIILDKYLLPLHQQKISRDELKKIFLTVQPQVQTQFVTIPPKYSSNQLSGLVKQLDRLCHKIQLLQFDSRPYEHMQQQYSALFDVVSRVKMIFITKLNQTLVLSQILGVCRRYTNYRLLQHTLLKIVPFFYCLNQYNSNIIQTLAEMLYFIVNQLNISCNWVVAHHSTKNNTFDARLYQFAQLNAYQAKEDSHAGSRHRVASGHQQRVHKLKAMYVQLVIFLGQHMHVCIAKGFSLSMLLRVFSINFLIQPMVMPQLPLQSVCRFLLTHLQLVTVLKSALEKGENSYDERMVDYFYQRTLKLALLHFQKEDSPENQLISSSFLIKSQKQRLDFLIQICDYLRNDDFHQLSKKKLPKRNQLFFKRQNQNLLLQMLKLGTKSSKVIKQPRRQSLFSMGQQQINLPVLRFALLYLISQQIDRTKAYSYPQLGSIHNPYSLAGKKGFITTSLVQDLLLAFNRKNGVILVYNFVKIFGDRVDNPQPIYDQIACYLRDHPIYNYPPFLSLYVKKNHNNPQKLREINYWKSPHIPILLECLEKTHQEAPSLARYATKVLGQLQSDQILFYLPQIFQSLTLRTGRVVSHFLLQYARKSNCFAHQLIWLAQVQSKQERDPHNKSPRLPGVQQHLNKLQTQAKRLIRNTICQFNRQETGFFNEVNTFYQKVTAISGKMKPQMPPADKKDIIRAQVQKIVPPKSAYLPFNTSLQLLQINKESGTPMQSAAKCPFLLAFKCAPYPGPDQYFTQRKLNRKQTLMLEQNQLPQEQLSKPMNSMNISASRVNPWGSSSSVTSNKIEQPPSHSVINSSRFKRKQQREVACIFKVFDDIRQDCLALQVIKLFLQIFERHRLNLNLFPYHTISNRTGQNSDIGGIIEVVPNCFSRDSIGKTNQESLYQFFVNNFGPEHNMGFQQARQNFIRSQAAYSVVSYILQVKDRHNGNILIDKQQGFLVHIDFGFILDISPANNLRFERADFKLTQQMIKIMGGSVQSQPFQLYLSLVIKAFLLARRYHQHVYNLVSLMAHSGLPCFLANSLDHLKQRFFLHLSEIQAAEKMRQIVLTAADHWTTNWYDRIQWIQQKIYH